MKKVLILYISTTGNTEQIAHLLNEALSDNDFDITTMSFDFTNLDALDLLQYDGILFGTHTYNDGDLPFETDVFLDTLLTLDLNNKIVGIFGSGDTSYSYFCEAVEIMKDEFALRNAIVLEHTVRVNLYPDLDQDLLSIHKLASLFQEALLE
ncbi:flavodoxin domain-containing protein [Sporosarcina siberiensis]|uniref:Flavodoxin domain-containing protein n=1 Tax=Sporosarcina siberiensis TaxID=1365606 RepID=A0ABW4SK80_9BACL